MVGSNQYADLRIARFRPRDYDAIVGLGAALRGLEEFDAAENGNIALTAELDLSRSREFTLGVAFGVLAGLQLSDAPPADVDAVYAFCEKVGLPTTLAALGLAKVSPQALAKAAAMACAPEQSIHHEAGTITPEKTLAAMIAADAIGRSRQ